MAFQFSITYGMHRMQYMYVGLNLYSVDMALNLNVLYSMNLNRNTNESLAAYFGTYYVNFTFYYYFYYSYWTTQKNLTILCTLNLYGFSFGIL